MKHPWLLALLTVAAVAYARPSAASPSEPEAFARVVVDEAELRSGPGISYRVIYEAHRGETFALDGRPGSGFWLRVLLADGRTAFALGDEVQPFAVDAGSRRCAVAARLPRAAAARRRPRGVSPSSAGVLSIPGVGRRRSELRLRRGAPVARAAQDASARRLPRRRPDLGRVRSSSTAAASTIYLAPDWPVCPFLGLGAGGSACFPNSDSFVLQRQDLFLARAGGGFLFALQNRILVRLEATNLSLFSSDSYKNAQLYSGGLGVYF